MPKSTCLSCFRNSEKQEVEDALCPHCTQPMIPIKVQPQSGSKLMSIGVLRCGDKWSLSKFEEIKLDAAAEAATTKGY